MARRIRPTAPQPPDLPLRDRLMAIEKAFRAEALRLDQAFLRDHREAVDDGKYDHDADRHRRWANKLRAIIREMAINGGQPCT
jgi:hypothetical protein